MKFIEFYYDFTHFILKELGIEQDLLKNIHALLHHFEEKYSEILDLKELVLFGIGLSDHKYSDVGDSIVYGIFCQVLDRILSKYEISFDEQYDVLKIKGAKIKFSEDRLYLEDWNLSPQQKEELLEELHEWEQFTALF
jgi:hypothetical protein